MEKKTNYNMKGMPNGFENLTPLLKNEYRLQNGKNKQEKNFEKKQKRSEFCGKSTEDVNVTKSINENSVDLVINVELRKRDLNYMDAYYTDLDLQGRKAYHEYGEKQDVPKRDLLMNNMTKFSDLNLMFTDNVADYSSSSKPSCFFNNEYGKNCIDDNCSLERLLHSAEENVKSFYGDYRNSKTAVEHSNRFFMKSGEKKLVKTWSPLYYANVLNKKPQGKYDIAVNRYDPSEPESSRLMRTNSRYDSGNSLSKISISYVNDRPEFKNNDLKVTPLALNVCNKNFTSIKNVVSISNCPNCVSQHHQYSSENQCENLAVTFSDPEINQQRRQLPSERLKLRKLCSMIKIPENPYQIKLYDDQSYSRYKEPRRPTYQSQYYDENFSKIDNANNDINRLAVDQNSYITNTLSSSDGCQDKLNQFKDKYYLKKKYHREQYHRYHVEKPVENCELSNILDINETCLLDFNPLKKSTQDENVNIEKPKTEMEETQSQSCWLTPKKLSEKILLKNINLESSSKMKTLEVLFPVKSLRICMDEIDKNCAHKSDSTNNPFMTSVTEVEVTKNMFIKKTELMRESLSKIIHDCNCKLAENKELINIQLSSTLIAREINENDRTICTKNNRNHLDLKMILSSNEFREEVINIIEQYLKENYLTDDNFDVIVVPKNEKSSEDNPIDALKRIISNQFCTSECDSVANERNFDLPDLSMFNPRDFKGHVSKYEKMYHDNPTIRSTNKSVKKKTIECSNCAEERNNRFRPATSKATELKAIKIVKSHKSLIKYQSMPAFKLQNQKSTFIMKDLVSKPCIKFFQERGTGGNKNITTDIPHSKTNAYQHDVGSNSLLNTAKDRNKYGGSEFLTEFNEFKELFDEVDIHHNALLHVLNYDPCGLLFQIKKGHLVSGNTKPNK